ncbi:MAG: hypothetical protein OEY22_03920 [Candidatus Bathyarchaeota archaeon]|nr:hypothetical protein [Candidatus Bathyarchaeota archaeon]MDH5788206.1 hypothetical protein [Candidatus Bathyarchaeota archaeon]
MKEKYAFVMMIREKWWRKFCHLNREGKRVLSYVKRGWAVPKNTFLILFYVAKPVGQLGGHAEFIERKVGDADSLWVEHGDESVLESKEEYYEFIQHKERVSFVRFKNLQEAAKPMPLSDILKLLGKRRLSRKGFYISKETADKFIALIS